MKPTKRHKRRPERGIALVAVLIAVAIILVISNEFGTSTTSDLWSAANYRDEVVAHFLARSSLNLGEILIRLQTRIDNVKQLRGMIQLTDPTIANMLVQPFCGTPEQVISAIGFSPSELKGLGADVGECGFEGPIATEDDKINVNCANNPTAMQAIYSMISTLIYFPAYDFVFDDNTADGWHRDRTLQAQAIIDYIDADTMVLNQRGTTEEYQYEALRDPYYAKNNYIDSVGEMKQIRGVDDRFWTLFGSSFTAYGGCKANLTALDNVQLIAAILFLSAQTPTDPVVTDPKRLFLLASYVAKAAEFGVQFQTYNDFISFVKDPGADVESIAVQDRGSMAGSAAQSALTQGLPGLREPIGLVLSKAKLAQIATVAPRRTYKLRAYGEVARKQIDSKGQPMFPPIRSTYTGVWDTKVVPQNARKTPMPNGAWVFLKEE